MKKELIASIKLIALAMVFSVGLSYVFAAEEDVVQIIPILSSSQAPIEQAKGGAVLSGSRLYIRGLLRTSSLTVEGTSSFSGNVSVGLSSSATRNVTVGNGFSIPNRLAVGYNVSGSALEKAGTDTTRGYVQLNNFSGSTLRKLCANRSGRFTVCP